MASQISTSFCLNFYLNRHIICLQDEMEAMSDNSEVSSDEELEAVETGNPIGFLLYLS